MHLEDNLKKKTLQKHYSGLYKLQIVKVANLLMSPDCLIRAGWCTVGVQVYNCHVWLNESLDPAADSDEVQLYLQKTKTEIDPHREKKQSPLEQLTEEIGSKEPEHKNTTSGKNCWSKRKYPGGKYSLVRKNSKTLKLQSRRQGRFSGERCSQLRTCKWITWHKGVLGSGLNSQADSRDSGTGESHEVAAENLPRPSTLP